MGDNTMNAIFTLCKFTVKSKDALQNLFTFCTACRSVGIMPVKYAMVRNGDNMKTSIEITRRHITPTFTNRINIGDTIEIMTIQIGDEVIL